GVTARTFDDVELHPPIGLSSLFGLVRGDGLCIALADGFETLGGNSAFSYQPGNDRFGSLLAQSPVELLPAAVVRVPFDTDARCLGKGLDDAHDVPQKLMAFGKQVGLAQRELHSLQQLDSTVG